MGGTPPLIPLHEVSQRTPRSLRSALWLPGCPPEHLVPIPRPFPLQAKKEALQTTQLQCNIITFRNKVNRINKLGCN